MLSLHDALPSWRPGTTAPWEPPRARILHPNPAGHMGSEGDVSGGRWRRPGPDAGERRRRGRANEPYPTEFGIAHRGSVARRRAPDSRRAAKRLQSTVAVVILRG